MSGLVEAALAILNASEHRARIASENVAGMTMPGYKKKFAIVQMPPVSGYATATIRTGAIANLAQGPLRSTGGDFDVAIQGRGFFVVVSENGDVTYTRQGQFQRADDGRIVTATGSALQQEGGGDLVVQGPDVQIMPDGTFLENGRPVGRVAVVAPREPSAMSQISGSGFSAPEAEMVEVPDASIRQGMLEGSNVSLGDEMLSLMTATRQAESGARLVQVYDELMGRALTTLGQRG